MKLHTVDIKLPVGRYPFIFYYVEDYPSLEDCIIAVEGSLLEVEDAKWGVVVMVFTDIDKLLLMPTYHTKYYINKVEVNESEAFVSNDDVEEVHNVEHKVDYTQGVADQTRLVLQYSESVYDRLLFESSFREAYL